MIYSLSLDKERNMEAEPSDSAEANRDICTRSVALDNSYTTTKQENLPNTNTLHVVSQASCEHTDMQMINATKESCPQCHGTAVEVQQLSLKMQKLKQRTLALQSRKILWLPKCVSFVSNDKQVRLNTGLPNKGALNSLFNLLKARTGGMRYWLRPNRLSTTFWRKNYRRTTSKSGPKRQLSCKDEFILTLMKLRLGLTNKFLSDLFGISPVMCSHIVNTWITFLARELHCLVFWPDKNQICCFMPEP